jgi:hypothetical protein
MDGWMESWNASLTVEEHFAFTSVKKGEEEEVIVVV